MPRACRPFCRRHAQDTFPLLRKDLIDSGKARYASIHYPIEQIHPAAVAAAMAAECAAEQGKFWEMYERLFSDDTATAAGRLDEHVESVGLDSLRFKKCLSSEDVVTKVRRDQEEGRRLHVSGTPAFFVGRLGRDGGVELLLRIDGARGPEVFAKAVDDARSAK